MEGTQAASGATAPFAFGSRLRTLREAAGLSQEELARRADLTGHAISALERGTRTRPYPHTVRALADALDLSDESRRQLLSSVPRRSTATPAARSSTPAPVGPPHGGRSLPVPATRLTGREREIDEVTLVLRRREGRILTLTGAGGVGKTRLAIAVAQRVGDDFPDGVVFVPLADLTRDDQVLPSIRQGLGLGPGDDLDRSDEESSGRLRELNLLLVLDNVEHLPGAAAKISDLLSRAPDMTVLATSRSLLEVRGETVYQVEPLPTVSLDGTSPSPAVQLFLERAHEAERSFTATAENVEAATAICRRLSGIPLALELAATKVRTLDGPQLLARLDEAMHRPGQRDLPLRQRSLHDAIAWSVDLLGEDERRLFRSLGVFPGGFSLEAVEAVATDAGSDTLASLESLVNQSLVCVDRDSGEARFSLLEPVRLFARDLLFASSDVHRVRHTHAAFFTDVLERAATDMSRGGQVARLEAVRRDHANHLAAIEHAVETGDGETAARIAWTIWLHWWLSGELSLGRSLSSAAVDLAPPAPWQVRARLVRATMAFAQGDIEAAREDWQRALAEATLGADRVGTANSWAGIGVVALTAGDLDTAADALSRTIPLADGNGAEGEWISALARVWLGTVRLLQGDVQAARELVQTALAMARERHDRLGIYVALYNLAQLEMSVGRDPAARGHLLEGIRLSVEMSDDANLAYFLDLLACVEEDPRRVATLVGGAQGLREAVGFHVRGYYVPDGSARDRATKQAADSLGQDAYDDVVDQGRAMSTAELVASALDR